VFLLSVLDVPELRACGATEVVLPFRRESEEMQGAGAGRRARNDEQVLEELRRFHGHLGPYAVVGYRMGLVANLKLGASPFEKRVVVKTGIGPPLSCIIDGIQYSSGCTLGKGNLFVSHQRIAEADFSHCESLLTVRLLPEIREEIEASLGNDLEAMARRIFAVPSERLFRTERGVSVAAQSVSPPFV
jgi:hypothetical protein